MKNVVKSYMIKFYQVQQYFWCVHRRHSSRVWDETAGTSGNYWRQVSWHKQQPSETRRDRSSHVPMCILAISFSTKHTQPTLWAYTRRILKF
jgi:hypothetical protein